MQNENKIILRGNLIQFALGILAIISVIIFLYLFLESAINHDLSKEVKIFYLLGSFIYLLVTTILIALYVIIEKIRDLQKTILDKK